MSEGPVYNTRYRIEIGKAPSGTANLVGLVLKANSAVKQDGHVFTGSCEARRVARIFKDVDMIRAGKWDIKMSFTRDGRELIPGSSEFMRDCPPEDLEGWQPPVPPGEPSTARPPAPPPSSAQPAPRAAPIPQASAPTRPSQEETELEGTSIPWQYGADYRVQDEDKLNTLARKKREPKDGKLKIQLGPLSDRQYLIEPNRGRGGGWKASRMFPDRDREVIATDPHYSRCVQAVRQYERRRAVAALEGAEALAEVLQPNRPAAAPKASPTKPVQVSGPVPTPTATSQKPFRLWSLKPGTSTRWSLELSDGVSEAGDDLEELLARTWAREPEATFVVGWTGQLPKIKREVAPLPPLPALPDPVDVPNGLADLGHDLLGEEDEAAL